MKLSNYLIQLAMNKDAVVTDRILYLYDTEHNTYFIKVIYPAHIDHAGALYEFFESDEPFYDREKVKVIKAWTIDDAVDCLMGVLVLSNRYCKSEV